MHAVSHPKHTAQVSYKYLVLNEQGTVDEAEQTQRTLKLPDKLQADACVLVRDSWQVMTPDLPIISAAPLQCIASQTSASCWAASPFGRCIKGA